MQKRLAGKGIDRDTLFTEISLAQIQADALDLGQGAALNSSRTFLKRQALDQARISGVTDPRHPGP